MYNFCIECKKLHRGVVMASADIKQKKLKNNLIFAICVISALFFISLIFNIRNNFGNSHVSSFFNTFGEDSKIVFEDKGSQSVVYMFNGDCLPGDIHHQTVSVVLPDMDLTNYTLRAKVYISGVHGTYAFAKIGGYDKWVKSETDNYYYYEDEIFALKTIGVCENIALPEVTISSRYDYSLVVTIELFKDI